MVLNKGQPMEEDKKLEVLRHSVAHVMAEAVQTIFPEAKFGIGPAIENGFYYDFDLSRSLTSDDLPLIEAKMSEIIALDVPFVNPSTGSELKVCQILMLRDETEGLLISMPPQRLAGSSCPVSVQCRYLYTSA